MGEVIYGDVKQYIEEMAEGLGVAAGHVYELLIKQQIVDGIVTAVLFVFTWLLLGSIFVLAFRKHTEDRRNGGKSDLWGIIMYVVGILLLSALLGGSVEVTSAVKQIVNPEYYAIREIMDVFKGGN